ncbi:MAG: hypothetical protein Q4G51_08150 [Dermatophilus congolensis]|nr:hypothetical protein [Dermatophilus congolensis]
MPEFTASASMSTGFMVLSVVSLALSVLAYGIGGAQLSTGSKAEGSPLASRTWWVGTAFQGLGFVFSFAARQALPLLIVQACIVGGLAVTAVIEHVAGKRRMRGTGWLAIAGVSLGIALLAATTVPGPAPATSTTHLAVIAAVVAACALAFLVRLPPSISGVFGGTGFAISAITARLLVADPGTPLFQPWEWGWRTWAAAVLLVLGLGLGQMHLTRGLSVANAVTVLSTNYLMSTLVPAAFGWALLGELPRAGTTWLVPIGLGLALLSAFVLIRDDGVGPDGVAAAVAPR